MMKPLINIIGAGQVGKTIARLIVIHQAGTIQGVCNTTSKSANNAIQFIGEGKPFAAIKSLPSSDITIITTPDDLIEPCCQQLSHSKNLKRDSIVFHCSGSLSSEILYSVAKQTFTASIHPMRSFAVPEIALAQYNGTYCAIEGHNQATHLLQDMFIVIGSITFFINGKNKAIYHAAGVFASNYLITIANAAMRCFEASGVENNLAFRILIDLMKGALNNLESTLSFQKSLTGPLKRGDVNTILKHFSSIPEKKLLDLYKTLALSTLEVSDLSYAIRKKIENLCK